LLFRSGLLKRTEEAAKAREVLRECEAMETEIALLKNKRTPAEVSPPVASLHW